MDNPKDQGSLIEKWPVFKRTIYVRIETNIENFPDGLVY